MSTLFTYPYLGFTVTVRVGDTLDLEVNRRSLSVPIEAVRFLYVASSRGHQQLIVAYDRPDGRRDVLRSSANGGARQFAALVDHLTALKPGADLRGRPRGEAFKQMGARDIERVAMQVVAALVVLLPFGLMAPYVIQGLRRGQQAAERG